MGIVLTKKIRTLINAIYQVHGIKLTLNTQQWYTPIDNRRLTAFILKQQIYDEEKDKNVQIELFKAFGHVDIMLYLRDMWYELNGQALPTDNKKWNEKRKEIKSIGKNKERTTQK